MSLASDRPEFTPPKTSGHGRAIGLAIFAHAFLIAALTWGVGWKREATNAPVQAELWSTTVQQAAPALVEPTPPPPQIEPKPEPKVEPPPPSPPPKPVKPVKLVEPEPEPEPKIDPQIAIEKAKKEEKKKLEKKKADEAKEKAKALAKKEAEEEAAEEARLEALNKKKRDLEASKLEAKKLEAKKLEAKKAADTKAAAENDKQLEAAIKAGREANLKRIAGLAGASGGETATGTAKQSTGPSAGYAGRVSARVKPNIVFTAEVSGNIEAGVEVKTSPDGTITGRKIIKSSGNKAWDDAVLRALDKTEILPKDSDGRVPSTLEMYFKPKDLL
jgi:colicin import membrane protein